MKKSKTYIFDKGIEIWVNHNQALRSEQCTPKFFRNPPTHPGQKPNDNETNSHVLTQWNKKAKKFAEYYLALFCPESNLYGGHQENIYSYELEDLVAFVSNLQQNNHIAINRFQLDYIINMIHSLNTSRRNQAILCGYPARNVTHWSEQEHYEKQQRN